MFVGRKASLARAIDLVQAGISVDIVGGRGSGRTTFLHALERRLLDNDWSVVTVRGIASLRQHPLAALHLAGIGGVTRSGATLHETAAALQAKLQVERSVLFLDDWNDLDEASWGVAESLRRRDGVAVVVSRLQGLRARHTPSGLDASSLEPSYVIDMSPLGFEEMEQALANYLQAPVESSTMSRIYAKSGGNIGLAVSLVDATSREGQLSLRGNEWVASRDLWSPGLRTVLEGYLENLDAPARDALEIIAIAGLASLETVRKLVDWSTLELLEERSMITFITSGKSQLIAVIPPLLVEFFRHEPLSARRVRLTELIVDRLGTAQSATAILAEQMYRPELTPEREALFVRLLHERARALRIVTASEWESVRSPSNAVRYVHALSHTFTASVDSTVQRVFAETDLSLEDVPDRAEFHALHARWQAYVEHDLEGARGYLAELRPTLGLYGRLVDAVDVEMAYNLEGLPEEFASALEVTDDLPDPVKSALLQTQLLVLTGAGRLSDAQRVLGDLEALGPLSPMSRVLHALTLLGRGDYATAIELLNRGLDESHGVLDIQGVREFGAAAITAYVFSGDIGGLDELIETIFAAGDPTPFPAGHQIALLSFGALSAIRQGQISTGERLIAEMDRLSTPDGPLPGQSRAWARAQLAVFNGEPKTGAQILWDSSERLWERHARFSALAGFLAAIEIEPTAERLASVREHLVVADESGTFRAQGDYLEAVFSEDSSGILAAAEGLHTRGRIGLALRAGQTALLLGERGHDPDIVERATALLNRLRDQHALKTIDATRFSVNAVTLTDREQEVARLAADGLSNQEIANHLVLSVRTVETHMHRVMRKLDVSSRHTIRSRLDDTPR